MTNPIRISVVGASGRMGQMLVKAVAENEETKLAGVIEQAGHDWIGQDIGKLIYGQEMGVFVSDQPHEVILKSQAIIDFTRPEVSVRYSTFAAQARIVHVIGTTGFTESHLEKFELAAQHAAIVRSGNMSLGVNLLTLLTKKVSKALGEDFDIEILEMHHNQKIDAPSGTALMLGEAAAAGREISLLNPSENSVFKAKAKREKGSIGFATLRGGDVVGEHDVIFSGLGERITLRHVATDRMIFARGAVAAAIWGIGKDPGQYSMTDVLGL